MEGPEAKAPGSEAEGPGPEAEVSGPETEVSGPVVCPVVFKKVSWWVDRAAGMARALLQGTPRGRPSEAARLRMRGGRSYEERHQPRHNERCMGPS
ncbi:hypothetical protein GCM10017673_29100 [Streptosporangium violaceochromogenes]|nr:hypothetical protein GCM10017673_29100 [Streptosporangium violaceochromogenes]